MATSLALLSLPLIAQSQYAAYTSDADGWRLVLRHKTPFHADGAWWPRGPSGFSVNSDDPNAALYSIVDSLNPDMRVNGEFIFKLSYPGMCTAPGRDGNTAAACALVENKETMIWRQTSNPYRADPAELSRTRDTVEGYQSIDTSPIDGYPVCQSDPTNQACFGGISYDGGNSLFQGIPDSGLWFWPVGATSAWGGRQTTAGPRWAAGGTQGDFKTTWAELYVYGNFDILADISWFGGRWNQSRLPVTGGPA